ncbi:unnamed protein product [Strongylus vulgaris]|uniref:Methyltransferase domain-containing protein n=1 Tax=Strongylus vulgaris TaxID=40348 RepID=A0A3P7M107_STRVU|nr:unnamed protein product [Strongylus vulgaris]
MGSNSAFSILYNAIVPEAQCPNLVRVGSVLDGGKYVCNPQAVNKNDCRIYSFGLNNEVSFEVNIQEITNKRCKIYGYDKVGRIHLTNSCRCE